MDANVLGRSASQTVAIGAEGDGIDPHRVSRDDEDFPACLLAPDPDGPIIAAAGQMPAIRTKRDGVDVSRMPAQDQALLSCRGVPDAHGLVRRGRRQELAAGAEAEAKDL